MSKPTHPVVWHDEQYLIMQTREGDGEFTPNGLFQIYKRVDGTDDWSRMPDYKGTGTIQWYKTLEAAKEALLNEYGHKLQQAPDALSGEGENTSESV